MASEKPPIKQFLCIVDYLGTTLIDKRFSGPMLPWVIAEIKLRSQREKMHLAVQEGWVRATPVRGKESRQGPFQHSLHHIIRFSQVYTNRLCFLYLLREPGDSLVACYLFEAKTSDTVVELFSAMREQAKEAPYGRSQSSAASLTSLCTDISPSSSHFFEVLYIGKIKVSHKKVPETFIDEALERFRLHDQEKLRRSRLLNGINSSSNQTTQNQIMTSSNTNTTTNESQGSDVSTTKLTLLRRSDSPENTITNGTLDNNSIDNPSDLINNTTYHNNQTSRETLVNLSEIGRSSSGGSETLVPLSEVGRSVSDEIKLRKPLLGQVEKPLLGSVETLASSSVNQSSAISSCQDIPPMRARTSSGDNMLTKQQSLDSLPGMRIRAGSTGSAGSPARMRRQATTTTPPSETAPTSDHNRTMLFLVGRSDLRLISPDRKQILLHKQLRDVATCVQGQKNSDHFGFICRESNVDNYVGYVFKCQSGSVVSDVVGAIVQANQSTTEAQKREKREGSSCEHCPMIWYHKLCAEVEGLSEKRQQTAILRRMEQLPVEEQELLFEKLRGGSVEGGPREQTELLMVLLRVHCEAKQTRHVHDTAENRSEFLNQYLGGGNTIFMKAKRSLTSSFDTLLKRRGSKDELGIVGKELSLPASSALARSDGGSGGGSPNIGSPRGSPAPSLPPSREEPEEELEGQVGMRPRSSTVGTSGGETMKREFLARQQQSTAQHRPGPMMNIFLKVGNTSKTPPSPIHSEPKENFKEATARTPGSWRQAIFQRVVTPNKALEEQRGGSSRRPERTTRRTREELRQLWRKAINQQRLLIRMEKENARLRARQEEATVKRIKLEYDEISPCAKEGGQIWDLLLSRSKSDPQMLLQALRQGVPRVKRGDVWQFLADKHNAKCAPPDLVSFPNYCVPYEDLLKQLTSHQHGILIDLGRTFPSHTYFSSPLGPGQLALFNLLKAYSLLDPEVGYCQGLSFVAGVLLLHVSEENAFALMKHVMFRRGLRKVYLPDMVALQVNLYQLSRLLHDLQPDLYAHFDSVEVAPTLYAAPWILTLFASQFPLGFVARVFDLLLLEGSDVIFRFAVALLAEHRERLMACDSFEEVMDYLKTQVPNVTKGVLDRVIKQVSQMEVSRQLREYEVEYHVLQEELATTAGQPDQLLELRDQNQELLQRLQMAESRLEASRSLQQATINRLESQVRSLESTLAVMARHIANTPAASDSLPPELRRYVSRFMVPVRANSDARPGSPILKVTPVNELNLQVQDDEGMLHKEHPLDMICTDVNFTVGSLPRGGTRRSPQPFARTAESNKSTVSRGGQDPVTREFSTVLRPPQMTPFPTQPGSTRNSMGGPGEVVQYSNRKPGMQEVPNH